MIVCPRCDKENQDHYKFCLGCGAELPRDAAKAPEGFTAPTPPAGVPIAAPPAPAQFGGAAAPTEAAPPAPAQFGGAAAAPAAPAFGGAPVAAPAAAPVPAAEAAPAAEPATDQGPLTCPKCSGDVPFNFKFCGTCGHNMSEVQAAAAAAAAAPAPAPAAAPTAAAANARGSLVLIRPDGTEGESFPLGDGTTVVGRDSAGPFASDAYLSPQHAEFRFDGDSVVVSDKSSLNGIFRKIAPEQPVPLATGAVFRVGQEILRFEDLASPEKPADGTELMGSPNPGFIGRIRLVVGRDGYGSSYCVPPGGMHLGRDRGDIIFPDDGYVSGLHCRIHGEPGNVQLTDVGSSNGTFIRLEEPTPLPTGTLLLMGMQLFRVEY